MSDTRGAGVAYEPRARGYGVAGDVAPGEARLELRIRQSWRWLPNPLTRHRLTSNIAIIFNSLH